jgi:hypothetical protein
MTIQGKVIPLKIAATLNRPPRKARRRQMVHRPAMIRDQDKVEIRLTREAEYRLPFTFIKALNEGTLFDRPAHVFGECGPAAAVVSHREPDQAPVSYNRHRADRNRRPRPRRSAA